MFLLAPRMGRLLNRTHTATLGLIGMSAQTLAYLLRCPSNPTWPTGTGFCQRWLSSASASGLASLPLVVVDDEQGLASGLVNTSLQIGAAVVLATFSGVLGISPSRGAGQLLDGMREGIAVVAVTAAIGALSSAGRLAILHRR